MLTKTLVQLYKRDLEQLKQEITAYKTEKQLWMVSNQISNSAGNLCLHIIGNLNYFIGAVLGKTGYVRQRDLEFSLKNVSAEEMVKQIDSTIAVIETSLNSLTEEDLLLEYKQNPFKSKVSTEFFLVHLATHLAYHLGQINYHRRLLDV
ncbi:DinB superfamily protein [Winogradskyella sp. J14-2]|uniref:DinB family protein n=1 Tax=Winogradskyella sp. J14-2 TaxID=1936080 RepID=UPI000972916B|nr:DinB family protein [Winogradskyella sp. J14-2]APY09512.1 DinB superfamily protein [Winogradskyella sp. J14-2]